MRRDVTADRAPDVCRQNQGLPLRVTPGGRTCGAVVCDRAARQCRCLRCQGRFAREERHRPARLDRAGRLRVPHPSRCGQTLPLAPKSQGWTTIRTKDDQSAIASAGVAVSETRKGRPQPPARTQGSFPGDPRPTEFKRSCSAMPLEQRFAANSCSPSPLWNCGAAVPSMSTASTIRSL